MASNRWSVQVNDDPIKLTPGADRYFHYVLRALQIVLASPVLVIYALGQAKPADRHPPGYNSNKWGFAIAVAVLSMIAASVCLIPRLRRWITWPLDFLLFFFWLVVLGLFEHIYVTGNPGGGGDSGSAKDQNDRHAVLLDLANMLLWMITFLVGVILTHNVWTSLLRAPWRRD